MTRALSAALLLILVPALSLPASAGAKSDASAVHFVDLQRLLGEFRKTSSFARTAQRLRDQAKTYNEEMEFLARLRYCSEMERKDALALKGRGSRIGKTEQARLDELLGKSDKLDTELAMLGQKENPSDADTARIQAISKIRTDAVRGLAKEEADRRDALRQLEMELLAQVEKDLLKLVTDLAKDRKLGVVYERKSVLFGGVDLTDDVVKKLPK